MRNRLLAAILMLAMATSLVACGNAGSGNTENTQQEGQANKDTEKESEKESEKEESPSYTIKVVDESGNPVAGVMVQLCKDSCVPKMTDANGVAVFTVKELEDGYKANVAKAPEGYTYEDGDVYFEDEVEVTLTLKSAQ